MIPILYESTETSFSTNGLGRLRDCIEAVCVEERNGVFELDFKYPTTGQNYEQIKLGRIVVAEHDDTGDVQPFDIVSCSRGIDGTVDFHCVHISYRLGKHVATGKNINSLSAAFSLFRNAQPTMPFTFSTDKSSNGYMACADGIPRTVREMMGGVEGSVLDAYGGEYKFDKFNVALLDHRGIERDLIIRYGVDMVDYNEDIDSSETYTSVVPFWSGNEQIVVGNKVASDFASITGRDECVPLDLSEKFENAPSPLVLTYTAVGELAKINPTLPAQTITVNFVRLSDSPEYEQYKGLYECQLCDTIKVVFPKYNMSGRFKIVKTTYDVLMERYTELELGTLSTSLSEALGVSNGLGGGSGAGQAEDYVVEEGASGDWTYRKWNSGVAECWRTIADNRPSTAFSATGSVYYRNVTGINFPSGLFTARPKVVVNADFGNVGSASATGVSATGLTITELSAVSTARAVTLDIYAVGTWR